MSFPARTDLLQTERLASSRVHVAGRCGRAISNTRKDHPTPQFSRRWRVDGQARKGRSPCNCASYASAAALRSAGFALGPKRLRALTISPLLANVRAGVCECVTHLGDDLARHQSRREGETILACRKTGAADEKFI